MGHSHKISDYGDKALTASLIIKLLLTCVQVIAGIYSGSTAVVADALHNFSDVIGLFITLGARVVSRKPADDFKTFGYKRIEVIAAIINLTTMVTMGIFLITEAIGHYLDPHPIDGNIVMIIALIAFFVNSFTTWLIHSISQTNLNIKAAVLHSFADALGSLAVLLAGVLILFYQLYIADIIITVLIACYIIYQGIIGFPKAINILVEATPHDLKLEDVIADLEEIEGVINAHHLHVWQIDEKRNALEAHIVIEALEEMEEIKIRLKKVLRDKYNIEHSTLEFEKYTHGFEKDSCN